MKSAARAERQGRKPSSPARRRVELQDAVIEAARGWAEVWKAGRFGFQLPYIVDAVDPDAAVDLAGRLSSLTEQLVEAVEELDR